VAEAMLDDPRFFRSVEHIFDTRVTPPIIRCIHCGLMKREYQFSDNPAKRNLRNSWCRECSRVEHERCDIDHIEEFWIWLGDELSRRPGFNFISRGVD
jgi:hypothetical protein